MFIHEPKRHARSALHGRINGTSNSIVATYDAVPYSNASECPKRVRANALLKRYRVKWRFRTKKPKGAKPRKGPQGNDARKFCTIPEITVGLGEILYEEELTAFEKACLEYAAERADEVMGTQIDADHREAMRSQSRAAQARQPSRSRLPSASTAGLRRQQEAAAAAAPAAVTPAAATDATAASTDDTAAAVTIPADDALKALRVPELQALCQQVGIAKWAAKGVLIERLQGRRDRRAATEVAAAAAGPSAAAASDVESGAEESGAESSGDATSDGETSAMSGDETGSDEEGDEGVDPAEEAARTEAPIEVAARTEANGTKVGGLATCVDVWRASIAFQTHRYEKYDDRDREAAATHGAEGQRLGAVWADALQRHTANKANWYYPHWARAHYLENASNGGAAQTDDTILENYNRAKKRLRNRVFKGGRRSSKETYTVKVAVQEYDAEGKPTGEYLIKKYKRKAPMADFEAIHRRCAIGKRLERKKPAPALKASAKAALMSRVKSEEKRGWIEVTQGRLLDLKARVEPVGASGA